MRMTARSLRWWNAAGFALVLVMNVLSVALPLGGVTTQELSERYPVLVTPAGYAFSIWSVIYALLGCFIVYQARPRTSRRASVGRIGPWFAISCLCNAGWLAAWHYGYVALSTFVMLALLVSLIVIYAGTRRTGRPKTSGEKLFVLLPFSVYLGWVSMAAIVNVSVMLYDSGWNGFGLPGTVWAVLLLLLATALGLSVGAVHSDPIYPLVLVWALAAIAVKQQERSSAVALTALCGAALLAVFVVLLAVHKRRSGVSG